MISRHWTGISASNRKDDYIRHLRTETFPQLAEIGGFISAEILHREMDGNIEFTVVTNWVDMASIKAFAGDDPFIAVVPKYVQELMISYDQLVKHFDVEK